MDDDLPFLFRRLYRFLPISLPARLGFSGFNRINRYYVLNNQHSPKPIAMVLKSKS